MNEQTLEMQIHATAQESIKTVDKLVSLLTNVDKNISSINQKISTTSSGIEKTSKEINSLKSNTDKATSSANKLSNTFKNLFTFVGTKRLTKTLLGWMDEAIDQTEQMNLFNVVFNNIEKNGTKMYSNLGKEATKFQYKLNEAFGTNKTQTFYMQGIFQSMGETVGIPEYYASIMSETSTKLTYDLASLFNKQEKDTAEAIRAGIFAGQTKPLRAYGIDVTQMSMQPILDSLGIDKQVKEMSQAEKEILRYLATLKQAQIAMGDLANTIESPANQMKVFRQQLVETKVAVSSLFIGEFSEILPYFNAFLMVIKEVSNAIATMFGIELTDYNSGIASQEGIYDGIADSVDDATKKVKELKRQTLGFDEIHNINENKDKSGNNVSGGIDQRLLDAIKGYDNGMDKVRMKATEIRDRIMDWLGFTKEIDPLTGKTSFKYQGINKTLESIWNSFKGLNTQGKILVGLGLYALVSKLFSGTKNLATSLGNGTGLLGVTKKLISPMKTLYQSLDNVNYYNKSLTKGLSEGITNWSQSLTMADKFKVSLVGVLGLSTSMAGMSSAMKSVSDEGWNLGNSLQAVASGLGGIASGAYIGSIFGPWGTIVGGASGAVLELISAISGYKTEAEKTADAIKETLKPINEFNEVLEEQYKTIEEQGTQQLNAVGVHKALLDELKQIVDENGKIKEGYEDRANTIIGILSDAYGVEIKMTDGVISNYGKLVDSIDTLIQKKKLEITQNIVSEKYEIALKNRQTIYENLIKSQEKYEETSQTIIDYDKKLEETWRKNERSLKSYYGNFEGYKKIMHESKPYTELLDAENSARNSLEKSQKAYNDTETVFMEYNGIMQAGYSGNANDIEYWTNRILTSHNNQTDSYEKLALGAEMSFNKQIELAKNSGQQINESIISSAESRYREVGSILANEVKQVQDVTDDYVNAWGILAQNSESTFLAYFKKLPERIQTEVVSKMQEKGINISTELQKGIKDVYQNVKFKSDTTEFDANSLLDKCKKTVNNFTYSMFGIKAFKADGGIYSNGTWKNIRQYANGGAPSHGSMFIAGERGAEIVGHINGKTEVLNQSQIASAIYSAVLSAMSQYSGQASEIDVHVHTDEGTVIDRIEQRTKQTGQFPFTIPTY